MKTTPFSDYALSSGLSADEIYTVELLIDYVEYDLDPKYRNRETDFGEARFKPDYQPHFSKDVAIPAGIALQKLSWVSFQRSRDTKRPVRDLKALRFLPELSELFLIGNEVKDISPLAACPKLRRLNLGGNPIRDLSPLASCPTIEELELWGTPITDYAVLGSLPRLRSLAISVDQIPAFTRLKKLPHLQKLKLSSEAFRSFEGFPDMPDLRKIYGAIVDSLQGLERFPKLQNLDLSGPFTSLEPLRASKALTHVQITESRVQSLEPLKGLSALRDLGLGTDARGIDLSPLYFLPALHEVWVGGKEGKPPALDKLRETLPSWDVEFLAAKPRHTPSLNLEVVDQETFDLYDTKKPFNWSDSDTNERLLSSELRWLQGRIEEFLEVDFEKDEDYSLSDRGNNARSTTVVLLSDRAVEAFPRLVLGIQKVLCHATKDWIIYFQSDDVKEEFVVWIYPDKIMVTKEHEKTVRKLIKPN